MADEPEYSQQRRSPCFRPCLIWFLAAITIACASSVAAHGQQIPQVLSGPASDQADYGYLSLILPRGGGSSSTSYELHYDLCNHRKDNMAFMWDDVGFGMDVTAPLPAGMCATYERTGNDYKVLSKTTLRFSHGSESPPAYVPCENETNCVAKPTSALGTLTAMLTTYLSKPKSGEPTTDRPVAVVLPLRVVVRSARGDMSSTRVRIDWVGKNIKFRVYLANTKMEVAELKQMITKWDGGALSVDTFPSLEGHTDLLIPAGEHSGFQIDPGEKVEFGNLMFELSAKAPKSRDITVIVLDGQNKPLARVDAPLPAAAQ